MWPPVSGAPEKGETDKGLIVGNEGILQQWLVLCDGRTETLSSFRKHLKGDEMWPPVSGAPEKGAQW
jgi:hypothetical protein